MFRLNKKLITVSIIIFLFAQLIPGQTETYSVSLAPFSTDKYDEFSPVSYNNGIVFCTNQNSELVSDYAGPLGKGVIKLFFTDTTDKSSRARVELFSKRLATIVNDGPVTFNRSGDTIYYSRNIIADKMAREFSGPRNKLGLFSAHSEGFDWKNIEEFRLNSEWYNITTPCLSPDGQRLYFASDKPGGYGGSDLYYCQKENGYWTDPVNLGDLINSPGNESYPFINSSGELFFSSDGHPGLGGKDIFFSKHSGTEWLKPVLIDPPVNSKYDDFGITADALFNKGYFSSNRNKSTDIFQFKTNIPQIFYTSIQTENQYCFMFSDTGSIMVDTTNLLYRWDFGDGNSSARAMANHCYKGPGHYDIKLDIVERRTGRLFFTKLLYSLEIKDIEQPWINSEDLALKGESLELDGLRSFLPGYAILDYTWDFGDGSRASGEKVSHSYKERGEYIVNLGLTLKSESDGKINKTGVSKKIIVFADVSEKTEFLAKRPSSGALVTDIRTYKNALIETLYSAESEIQHESLFAVELLSSKTKVDLSNTVFRKVPQKYTVRESVDPDSGLFHYIADTQMSLMASYPAYREMAALGFETTRIIILALNEPVEKELYNIVKGNVVFAENFFDNSEKLTSNGYIMLDQIVKLLNKYPSARIEVSVHTDNTDTVEKSRELTQKRAQMLVDYLINRNISANRLVPAGYGGTKPVTTNFLQKDRKLNQRVDFKII